MLNIDKSWNPVKNYLYQEPLETLNKKILPNISYQPPKKDIFNVFQMSVKKIKVVLLGQDPYPRPGDAIGYAFRIRENRKFPVSLRNMEKEIISTTNSKSINIDKWSEQGVFLLNTALTVETGKAGSHLKHWSNFNTAVIRYISAVNPCIWLLLGKKAQSFKSNIKQEIIDVNKYDDKLIEKMPINDRYNYIVSAPHPAAEAYSNAGFFGSKCFHYVNRVLSKLNKLEIIW